ncbi:MAG: flagellar filament capping protein FliD [Planctomycetota bacterium]
MEFTELTSLQDVVDGINAAGAGVSATIVNAGTSDTPNYRVLMQSESTGAANTVSVTTDDTDGISGSGLDQLFADTDELRAAQDSLVELTVGDAASGNQFVVSGSSDTNQVQDIVDGISITANKVGTASLTVAFDTEPAKEAITEFVTEFNSALEYHRDNASYDEAEEEAGILFSESDIRFALDAVKQTFINGSVDGDGSIKTLSAIGITLNENNGYFELDEDVLDQVLAADPQGVSDLFIRDGLGQRMDDKMSVLTESVDGLLATKDSSLSTQIQGLSERITDMDARLEQRRQRYEAQFLNMEKLMAQFQTQEQFLTGQIEAFANMAAGSAGKK